MALAGVGIFSELLAIPNDATDIQLVVENADATLTIAVDRAGTPSVATRACDALPVQLNCNALWRSTGYVLRENAKDDCGFRLIDCAAPTVRTSIGRELMHNIVAIRVASCTLAALDHTALPAMGLRCDLFELHRAHRALKANVHLVDLSLFEGDQSNIVVGSADEYMGCAFLAAAQAIDGFGKNHVELPLPNTCKQLLDAGAQQQRATDFGVAENMSDSPVSFSCKLAQQANLVVDRVGRL